MAFWSRKSAPEPAPEPARGWGRPLDLTPDPVVAEPVVVEVVPPGDGWTARTTDGTGVEVFTRPLSEAAEGLRLWSELVARHAGTGLWPVLVGEAFWEAVELEEVEVAATATSGAAWLTDVLTHAAIDDPLVDWVGRGEQPGLPPSAVGGAARAEQVASALDDVVELVLVPAAADWLVPKALGWDGAVNQGSDERRARAGAASAGRAATAPASSR